MSKQTDFSGPIFVVGMPRSGTKLLREILNNHSLVAIPSYESHFLPYLHKHVDGFGDLSNRQNFSKFFAEFSDAMFYKALIAEHPFITEDSWYEKIDDYSYAGVIRTFYQEYSRYMGKTIWGDKTPFYLVIIPLIKQLYPEAKIVHIIRDARDYCLSFRKSFLKNIYRSVQKWHDNILRARRDGEHHAQGDYHEVFYEKMIDAPEATLKPLCEFLGIPYEDSMSAMTKPSQHGSGDAKGYVGIMKQNYRKWEKAFKPKEIRKMEIICGGLLSELGYPVSYDGKNRRLNKLELTYYKTLDALTQVKFELAKNSPREAIWKLFQARKYVEFRRADQPESTAAKQSSNQ